jgi:hypothetical protein
MLRRKAASDYLRETYGVSRAVSTLAKLAVTGGGPPFRRDGRLPLYAPDDLDTWAKAILSAPLQSTSDAGGGRRRSRSSATQADAMA